MDPEDAEVWSASGLDSDLDRRADQDHLPYAHGVYRQRAEEASERPEDDNAVLMIEALDAVVVGGLSVQTPNRRADVATASDSRVP